MHTVVETPSYLAAAKDAGADEGVRIEIAAVVAGDPQHGDLIAGAGGLRKFRHGKPGQGKRGGFRVLSYYHSVEYPVLITIFGKSQKDNLSQAERNVLGGMVKRLVETYARKDFTA